ncbi:hypothetical protein BDQ12DRAFT_685713 [Crucibulum laeve]|uniref:Probable RNA-binding protein 18 n=1 Tax=Crucibulum laeve TaxID=68775 RepID=A0A5C3LVA8_9AGAR|nr:hypothetical protein BDQ12DRAFT_685713 [Crucibulum laeve]
MDMDISDSLDSLLPGPNQPSTSSLSDHLSYPTHEDEAIVDQLEQPEQPRQLLKDRLYIGNLHPSVDEYSLLKIFSKFGKVSKLDFLFHKTGLLKGKPRGYAFIEYGNKDDARKALMLAHDKLLRGRKLVVTYAHQAPLDSSGAPSPYGAPGKHRKGMMETGRPTTLSMLKTGMGSRRDGTQDKIARMEAKLRQMESTNPKPAPPRSDASSPSTPVTSQLSTLPIHPSLPLKPPPQLSLNKSTPLPQANSSQMPLKPKIPLPSLPFFPSARSSHLNTPPLSRPNSTSISKSSLTPKSTSSLTPVSLGPHQPRAAHVAKSKLLGVKIKPKEKEKRSTPEVK